MEEMLTRESVKLWKREPMTAAILQKAQEELNTAVFLLGDGATIGDTVDETAQATIAQIGYIRGLRYLLEFEGMDQEDKESTEA